ncbi:hypothetical protein C789_3990 [Microcystis aeruginosa FACHB-905 = DIANCHI905]|uniref:Uncharacterized protein n=1 Tax=Microcystis aeruginosa PCC 7806SL TaxID=1903187 RepID=A0AB33BPC5_MICA7|nr:hypothetical protein BH695_2900 [Microcystis aeruginosa PCC 7806SL]ELS46234.1 hypothetical protein C789_3990 [Microcystis aeruginosa FACHB-905 = DIANCHI905]
MRFFSSGEGKNPIATLVNLSRWLFSTLCDNFCLWNREMLIGQDF